MDSSCKGDTKRPKKNGEKLKCAEEMRYHKTGEGPFEESVGLSMDRSNGGRNQRGGGGCVLTS